MGANDLENRIKKVLEKSNQKLKGKVNRGRGKGIIESI